MTLHLVHTTVAVPVEDRLRFHRAESAWHPIEETEGLLGRLGGWVTRAHRAEILALWTEPTAREAALPLLPETTEHPRTVEAGPAELVVHAGSGVPRALQDTEYLVLQPVSEPVGPHPGLLAEVVGTTLRAELWASALHAAEFGAPSDAGVRVVPGWRIPYRRWRGV